MTPGNLTTLAELSLKSSENMACIMSHLLLNIQAHEDSLKFYLSSYTLPSVRVCGLQEFRPQVETKCQKTAPRINRIHSGDSQVSKKLFGLIQI